MRGMSLKDYITALPADQREAFALRCGTTVGHLNNVMYGYKAASPWLAVAIERETGAAIKRQDLREDWRDLWPELSQQAAA